MNLILSAAFALATVMTAHAANNCFWWGTTGDNLWSNAANWRNGLKPAAGDTVWIYGDYCKTYDHGANPGLVIVDEDVTNVCFEIYVSGGSITSADSVPEVTLKCKPGVSINTSGKNFSLSTKVFRLVLEDFVIRGMDRLNVFGPIDIRGDSDIDLLSGTAENKCFHINNNADVTLWGGRLATSRFNYANMDKGPGKMTIRGGEFSFAAIDGYYTVANAGYEQLGGTVRFTNTTAGLADPKFLPKGGRFIYDTTSGTAFLPYVASDQVAHIGGEIVMTNVTSSSDSARVYMDKLNAWMISETTQTFGRIYITTPATCGDFRLPALNVHAAINTAVSSYPVRFHGGLSLGAFKANQTWDRAQHTVYGPLVFRTTDLLDGTTARTFSVGNMTQTRAPSLAVTGAGTVNLLLDANATGDLTTAHPWQYSELSVDAGATLYLYSNGTGVHAVHAQRMTIGDNATLDINYPLVMLRAFDKPAIGKNVKVKVRLPKTYKGTLFGYPVAGKIFPIVDFGWGADLSDVTAEITVNETGTDWQLKKMGSCIVAMDAAYDYTPSTSVWCWTGLGADCKMSTAENWSKGTVPSAQNRYDFDGITRTIVTNDLEQYTGVFGPGARPSILSVASPGSSYHTSKAAPFTLRGNPIYPSAGGYTSSSASVFLGSECPLVIECDMAKSSGNTFSVVCNGQGWVGLMGTVAVSGKNFVVGGDVVIGGTTTCGNLEFTKAYTSGRTGTSYLNILSNGTFIVENQTANQTNGTKTPAKFSVAKGGLFEIRQGIFCNHYAAMTECVVDGTARFAKLGGPKNFEIVGTGVLEIGGVSAVEGSASTIAVGEGLTVRPASWETVSADVPNTPIAMKVLDAVTLGATNDWTYGAAAGVETTTTAADRAIMVADVGARVTFDTEDPATKEGHTITLADPILGSYVKVVKKGAGTLALTSATNEIHTLAVEDGTFAWFSDLTVSNLNLTANATLVAVADAEESVPTLAVDADVDLNGATVALDGVTTQGWKDVLTVPAGRRIFGTPVARKGYKARIVSTDAGGEKLRIAPYAGLMLLIR